MRTEIVPATAEMIERFRKCATERTVRAYAAVRGADVIGVFGVYRQPAHLVMFADLTDTMRKDKRAMVHGYRRMLELVKRIGLPVVSIADEDVDGSDVLLTHMGFAPVSERVYAWLN